jgi:hypothetical protein
MHLLVLVSVALLGACRKAPGEVPAELIQPRAELPSAAPPTGVAAGAEAPTGDLLRTLSLRDPEPSCVQLAALGTPEELIEVAEAVLHPPWAGMRAAGCVVSAHAVESEQALTRWVADPALAGLARLVAGGLDGMDADLAQRLGAAAMAGPLADDLRSLVAGSSHADVAALAAE